MMSGEATAGLQPFELLPPQYRNRRRVRHVFYGWASVLGSLAAVLCGVAVATSIRAHKEAQLRQQLVAASLPLFDLRRDVHQLEHRNSQRAKWCRWVESARPDDQLFQTMAAVVIAPKPDDGEIKIDRLHVKLPIEYPLDEQETPSWALPQLSIAARTTPEAAQRWAERLNRSDRIQAASVEETPVHIGHRQLRITATPLSSRVLP